MKLLYCMNTHRFCFVTTPASYCNVSYKLSFFLILFKYLCIFCLSCSLFSIVNEHMCSHKIYLANHTHKELPPVTLCCIMEMQHKHCCFVLRERLDKFNFIHVWKTLLPKVNTCREPGLINPVSMIWPMASPQQHISQSGARAASSWYASTPQKHSYF